MSLPGQLSLPLPRTRERNARTVAAPLPVGACCLIIAFFSGVLWHLIILTVQALADRMGG